MIRDWTKTNLFKHGRDGGQKFLNNRLEIKNNFSEAITTKRLMKSCFKELNCYLMPGLGLEDEGQEFSGDVTKLGQPFTQCFRELMSETLNANKLKPKMIRNKCLKGSELMPFFEVYTSLLSRPELPTHNEINAATTKTLDIITINEYKVCVAYSLSSDSSIASIYRKDIQNFWINLLNPKNRLLLEKS